MYGLVTRAVMSCLWSFRRRIRGSEEDEGLELEGV